MGNKIICFSDNRADVTVAFKDYLNHYLSEIENIKKAGPIAYADYYILNNSTLEDYENRLKEILTQIGGVNNES